MSKKNNNKDSEFYKRIIRAKEFINDCYSEQINIDRIAREAYFSPYHFIRMFKQTYHITPHQYLTLRRIERAKELLKDENYSITDICFELGFESPGSFSTLFSRYTGLSPLKFRNLSIRKIYLSVNFPEKLVPGCFLSFYKGLQN